MKIAKKAPTGKARILDVSNVVTLLDEKIMLNVIEFAAIIGCSPQSLYVNPPIPPKKIGHRLRWLTKDVKTYITAL